MNTVKALVLRQLKRYKMYRITNALNKNLKYCQFGEKILVLLDFWVRH